MNNQFKSSPTKTILIITVGILVIFISSNWQPALLIAVFIGLGGIFSNEFSIRIESLWMKLSWVLSLIVPKIILTIVYYILLTPIAILSRLIAKKDELSLKNTKSSLFNECNKKFDKNSFKNPW